MKQLKEDIKNKDVKGVYLLYGDEQYLKRYYSNSLKSAVITPEQEQMNFKELKEKQASFDAISSFAETPPFLSEKKVILVKNSGLFKVGSKAESEKLSKYLEDLYDATVIIFSENDVDKRGKLYKTIYKKGVVAELKTPDEKTLVKWIIKEFSKNGVECGNNEAFWLIRYTNGSMDAIYSEIEKLSSYKNNTGSIEKADIDSICIKAFETKIFDLVDAVGRKDVNKAMEIYRNMVIMKEPPIKIMAMVVRQIRLIYQCGALKAECISNADIAKTIGQRDFVVRECLKQSENFTQQKLKKALESCLESDIAIKTGRISDEVALELIIMEMCQ